MLKVVEHEKHRGCLRYPRRVAAPHVAKTWFRATPPRKIINTHLNQESALTVFGYNPAFGKTQFLS